MKTREHTSAIPSPRKTSPTVIAFRACGVGVGEIMTSVQIAMSAGLPYSALRDTILAHPSLVGGLIPLLSSVPSLPRSADAKADRGATRQSSQSAPAVHADPSSH
jgi:hypothetical protein